MFPWCIGWFGWLMPALLTMTSMRPKRAVAAAMSRAMSAERVTSVVQESGRPEQPLR